MISSFMNLFELPASGPGTDSPEVQWARVVGFSASSVIKDKLMSFGIVPGVKIYCERRIPMSTTKVYQLESWRGVLRKDEALEVLIERVAT